MESGDGVLLIQDVPRQSTPRWVMMALYFIQTGAAVSGVEQFIIITYILIIRHQAGLVKFFPVFFAKTLHYSATRIGILCVVGSIANFAGGIFWGRIADMTGRYKFTMVTTNRAFSADIMRW
jgi:hypothetical protein